MNLRRDRDGRTESRGTTHSDPARCGRLDPRAGGAAPSTWLRAGGFDTNGEDPALSLALPEIQGG